MTIKVTKKNSRVMRTGSSSCIREEQAEGCEVNVVYRSGSTSQARGQGTLVTMRCRPDGLVGDKWNDQGATFVLRTFESFNKTELNIYTDTKPPVFLSGRDARALMNLLQLHFNEKDAHETLLKHSKVASRRRNR